MREPVSAVIITRDAGTQLGACLQGLGFVDEILIVDSGSRDNTVELAKTHGARVMHQDWLGYGPQKQFAAEQALHDWILSLDADERISDALREDIVRELSDESAYARHLRNHGCSHSPQEWRRFSEERFAAKYTRPKCC